MTAVVALLGPVSICVMFVVLGLLSNRLGRVTRTRPYYVGFYVAALLVGASTLWRLVTPAGQAEASVGEVTLMALGVTLGAFVAWRYWSWSFLE